MKIVPKYFTCSQCRFFDPSFKSVHYPASYGLCRNPRQAYRDYLGDGSSASVQPMMHHSDHCGRFEAIGQGELSLGQDDNLIRRVMREG